jgi:hypothetical protein
LDAGENTGSVAPPSKDEGGKKPRMMPLTVAGPRRNLTGFPSTSGKNVLTGNGEGSQTEKEKPPRFPGAAFGPA